VELEVPVGFSERGVPRGLFVDGNRLKVCPKLEEVNLQSRDASLPTDDTICASAAVTNLFFKTLKSFAHSIVSFPVGVRECAPRPPTGGCSKLQGACTPSGYFPPLPPFKMP